MTVARFLLDTNICIFIRRQRPPSVLRRFERLKSGEAVLSVITYGELLYGVHKSGRLEEMLPKLQELVQLIPVAPMPLEAAEAYGSIRANLSANGAMIGNNDLWIAAHAISSELTLVTSNEGEFRRVPKLRVVNWAHRA